MIPLKKISKKTYYQLIIEFILIIIGVFSALTVDNFREQYQESQRELEYLRALKSAVQDDTAAIKNDVYQLFQKQKSIEQILSILEKHEKIETEKFQSSMMNVLMTLDLIFNTSVYEELKYTGNLRLISNETLKNSIINYYLFMDHFMLLNQQTEDNIINSIDPDIIDAIDLKEWTLKQPFSQDKILANIENNKALKEKLKRNVYFLSAKKNGLIYSCLPRSLELLEKINFELENK